MKTNMLTIAALLLTVAAVTSMISATPMAAYAGGDHDGGDHDGRDRDGGDISKTNTEQKLRQDNIGDSDSTNFNCGQNLINSPNIDQFCDNIETEDGTDGVVPPVVVTCEECLATLEAELTGLDATTVLAALTTATFDCDGLTAAEITTLTATLDALTLTASGEASVAEFLDCLIDSLV
jgi:hypothetical protein